MREGETESERNILSTGTDSNSHGGLGKTGLQPGTWHSVWVSHVDAGDQALEPSVSALTGAAARGWMGSGIARTQIS